MNTEQQRQSQRRVAPPPPRPAAPAREAAPPPPVAARPATARQNLQAWLPTGAVLIGFAIAAIAPPLFGASSSGPGQRVSPEKIAATLAWQRAPSIAMPKDAEPWPSCVLSAPASVIGDLDLVLAVDTTSSMERVIEDVKKNLAALISNVAARGGTTRIGVVAYRDTGDAYVTRTFPLTVLDDVGVKALTAFVAGLRAQGGGDWPEAVDTALAEAVAMPWRPAVTASIVIIGDAPAHQGASRARANQLAANFSGRTGGQVSVIDAGSGPHFFLRDLPEAGGGQYVTYDGNILNSLFPAITGCASR